MTNRTKQINGVEYPLTEQENTIRDAEEAQALIDKQTEEQVKAQALIDKQTEETKKASGKQKLLDLGLDEDEVKALIGA
jgi:predicted P-loop ATPase